MIGGEDGRAACRRRGWTVDVEIVEVVYQKGGVAIVEEDPAEGFWKRAEYPRASLAAEGEADS